MSDATQIKGMGAVPHAGGVAFRVWAPHAQCVSVIGSFKTSLLESRGHSAAPNHRIAPLYAKARGERFERVFFTDLQRVCTDKEVQILRDMARKIRVPEEISKPIRNAAIAKQELPRNQQEGLHADGAAKTLEAEAKIK